MEKPSVEVTEEEFQHELTELRESRATIEPVEEDRALVDGDWAQISYNGKIEGERRCRARSPGEDTLVEIGGKDTVEAFTDALRGAKPGQELKAEVIYPADYAEAKLAGKTVAYEVDGKGHQEAHRARAERRIRQGNGRTTRAWPSWKTASASTWPTASGAAWKAKPRTGCLPR